MNFESFEIFPTRFLWILKVLKMRHMFHPIIDAWIELFMWIFEKLLDLYYWILDYFENNKGRP